MLPKRSQSLGIVAALVVTRCSASCAVTRSAICPKQFDFFLQGLDLVLKLIFERLNLPAQDIDHRVRRY